MCHEQMPSSLFNELEIVHTTANTKSCLHIGLHLLLSKEPGFSATILAYFFKTCLLLSNTTCGLAKSQPSQQQHWSTSSRVSPSRQQHSQPFSSSQQQHWSSSPITVNKGQNTGFLLAFDYPKTSCIDLNCEWDNFIYKKCSYINLYVRYST
jgi:hypothetical protein